MKSQRRDFFVTGTDTGVGKTLAATALLRGLRSSDLVVAGMKPVASGAQRTAAGLRNADALALAAECSRTWPYEVLNPYVFAPPIAPHLAAQEAGVRLSIGPIRSALARLRKATDVVVVEGAGGWLVPFARGRSFADLPAALGLEVILVVGLRLGCLNHAFLTAEAVAARGAKLAGWIGSTLDPGFEQAAENLQSLRCGLPAPCIGVIPHLEKPDPGSAAACFKGLPALFRGA